MTEENFEEIVASALDDLPREFRARLQNVDVVIQDWPTAEQIRAARVPPGHTLFGLYHGVPLTQRIGLPPLYPDTITLFREPLVRAHLQPEVLQQQIRH